MADNYLERQYDAYQARKAEQQRRRQLQFQKQLRAYKERLKAQQQPSQQPQE